VVAVLAVVALVGVLAVIDRRSRPDGDDRAEAGSDAETTTTADRPTRTSALLNTPTTPQVRVFEPTIPLPAGQRLLGWVAPGWGEILDPATGTVTSTRLASGSEFISVVPRLGGAVVLNGGSASAQWFPQLPTSDEPGLVQTGAAEIFASEIADRVWIVRSFDPIVFAEFNLITGEVSDEVRLPVGYPRGSIDGGLVIQAPGGLFAYRRGQPGFEPIAAGEYVASRGSLVAYQRCDERLACPIYVSDLADGSVTELAGTVADDGAYFADGEFSPDGRWLAVVADAPSGWRITVVETATGRSLPVSAGPARTSGAQLAWTPDGEWLLWPETPGIRGFHPSDNTAAFIDSGGGAYQGVVVLAGPAPPGG
jgi:hypothetical protein